MNRDIIDVIIGNVGAIILLVVAFLIVRAIWRALRRISSAARRIKAEDIAHSAGRATAAAERKAAELRDAFRDGRR